MKKSTAVLWILVFTAILAGTYAKIHNSGIRRLTSHDWALRSLSEIAGESPIGFACDSCSKILSFDSGHTFTLTEACNGKEWSGVYEAKRVVTDIQLSLTFNQDAMTAPGVCSKTYYSNKASRETIVLNIGNTVLTFQEPPDG